MGLPSPAEKKALADAAATAAAAVHPAVEEQEEQEEEDIVTNDARYVVVGKTDAWWPSRVVATPYST